MKADKYKADVGTNQLTKFIEGHDSEDHYNLQGDIQLAGVV
jgi:hypothetical protein